MWIQFVTFTTAIKFCGVQPIDTVCKLAVVTCVTLLDYKVTHIHLLIKITLTRSVTYYGVVQSLTIQLNLLAHIQLLLNTTLIQFVTYDKTCQFAITVL